MKVNRILSPAALVLIALSGPTIAAQNTQKPDALPLTGDIAGTHDPSIAKDGGTYYVFATGAVYAPRPTYTDSIPPAPTAPPAGASTPPRRGTPIGQFAVRCSADLLSWKRCGQVFSAIPPWIKTLSPRTEELWAPDISFFDGQYHLYYAFSVFGKNTSGIALATSKTLAFTSPDYKWVDHGLVLQSTEHDDFNAIDPNLVLDADGSPWLAFGSFWSGIKMRRLDRKTGLLSETDKKTYALASRAKPEHPEAAKPGLPPDSEAVEAPFILHHGDYYYLFVSWDLCCRGVKSTYRTMMGRSKHVTGPYLDKAGKSMTEGGGSPLLVANDKWLGPGGESLLHLPAGDIIVFHAYDAHTGRPSLHISTLAWSEGWPAAALDGDSR